MKREFIWNEELGYAECRIYYKDTVIYGFATCHDSDEDFKSERTGSFIAESRANIRLWQFQKNNEIKPALVALKHTLSSWESSKNYNPKSFEAKSLRRQIRAKENDLAITNNNIAMEKQYLRDYLKNKDIVHTKLRNRAKQAETN